MISGGGAHNNLLAHRTRTLRLSLRDAKGGGYAILSIMHTVEQGQAPRRQGLQDPVPDDRSAHLGRRDAEQCRGGATEDRRLLRVRQVRGVQHVLDRRRRPGIGIVGADHQPVGADLGHEMT